MKSRQLTHTQSKNLLRIIAGVLILLLSWYVISRFIRVISGPSIITLAATIVDEEHPGFIRVEGMTKNTKSLLINDHLISPATDGGFEYLLVTPPGFSTIELTAFDTFDNQVTERLALYTDEPPDATSLTPINQPPEDTDVESEESLETTNS